MEIRTKFDVKQQVWFIHKDRIHKGHIHSIDVSKSECMQYEVYRVTLGCDIILRNNSEIFDSKESLINSIG